MESKGSNDCLKDSSGEDDDFVHINLLGKDNGRSQDILQSDLQSIDSLDSIAKSVDSLENDNITDSLEDLTCEFEESSLMRSMDQDLENVIAEATKLQTQVLESIIGGNEDGKAAPIVSEKDNKNDEFYLFYVLIKIKVG